MGTASTKKFIKNTGGALTEEAALTTSAGAGDADKVPALNAGGVLDPSILNAVNTSAGAGDAAKIAQLDGSGRLSSTMLPVGVGADTQSIIASETLLAGDLVNVWNNASAFNVRKADASISGKDAHGFVLAGVSASASATVYFEGTNTQMTGLLAGAQFLSATTPGKTSATAPTATGQVVQKVGFATSATTLNFDSGATITLA